MMLRIQNSSRWSCRNSLYEIRMYILMHRKDVFGFLRIAVQDHPEISSCIESVFSAGHRGELDFMQESRALLMLRRAIGDMIAEEISKFQSSDLRLGKELLSYVEISYDGLVTKIAQIEKSV